MGFNPGREWTVVPYDERDEDTRRFTPSFEDEAFLDAVRELDLPTTQDVADAVGCTRQNAYYRLKKLEERGEVGSQKVGNANVWSV